MIIPLEMGGSELDEGRVTSWPVLCIPRSGFIKLRENSPFSINGISFKRIDFQHIRTSLNHLFLLWPIIP
jgi:hypothetical protein